MDIITRKSALALGLIRYFTGKPCKRNHISERYVMGSTCIECEKSRQIEQKDVISANKRRYYDNNKEKVKNKASQWRKENPEQCKQTKMEYYNKNKESILSSKREYYQNNKEHTLETNKQYRNAHKEELDKKQKIYRDTHKLQIAQYSRRWRMSNTKKLKTLKYKYHQDNKESIIAKVAQWRKNNPEKALALSNKRRAGKLQAIPQWYDHDIVQSIYYLAKEMELATSAAGYPIKYHVDHVIPLQGELVCGLHVHTNLQILTAFENLSKYNIYH